MAKRKGRKRNRAFRWLGIVFLMLLLVSGITLGVAYYYKSDILLAINKELKENVNGDVALRDITFSLWDEYPGLSMTIHDIYLRGPNYDRFRKDFFNAKKVHISLRLLPLLRKTLIVRSIRITEASINLVRATDGNSNLEIFKKKNEPEDTATDKSPISVFLRRLQLEDVRLSFEDSLKGKSLGFHFKDVKCRIERIDSSRNVKIDGPMLFNGIVLNPALGGYMTNTSAVVALDLEFKPAFRGMVVRSSSIRLDKSLINLSGQFDFAKPGGFLLDISANQLDYGEGASVLTTAIQRTLSKISVKKPVDVSVLVKGQLSGGTQPEVDVAFRLKDTDLQAFSVKATKATVTGSFSNHVDRTKANDDYNSRVQLENFDGELMGLRTYVKATILNLKDPHLEILTTMDVPLRDFKSIVSPSQIRFEAGKFSSRVQYSGKIKEFLDSAKTGMEGKLSGSAHLTDGSMDYVPRGDNYRKINLSIHFDQNHVGIEKIGFVFNKNTISLSGELMGFVPFLVLPEKTGDAILNVYSPSLDILSLKSRGPGAKKQEPKKTSNDKVGQMIDKILEVVRFELNVKLDKVIYGKMNGTAMNGKFILKNNNLEAQNVGMNLADGHISLSMGLSNIDKPYSPVWIRSRVQHADVKKFFYSFDNFKLTAITWQNLEGKIDMQSFVRSQVDDKFNLSMASTSGNLDLVLKNGKLINFEPLENMSNFLFKKRDFSNVEFAEIRTHIAMQGKEFDISKMEVESNILRLFIEGRYSLTGHTDMSVQVPLSNLKKRDKDYKPENVGVDQKVGMSVFLHVHNDEEGKTVIAYDPFKKHVRKPGEVTSSKSGKR